MSGAVLPNLELIYQTGLDPRTGLPLKLAEASSLLKDNVRSQLRINDEQMAVNRYVWHDLPKGLNSQLVERILYYRGRGCFFYMESVDRFFFLPYNLVGNLDVYGRYMKVTPLTMAGTKISDESDDGKAWIPGLELQVQNDIILPEDLDIDAFNNSAVLLNDYTPQLSNTILPRARVMDPLLDAMADCIPFMHTALMNSTGVEGIRVGDESEQGNVQAANSSTLRAALIGHRYIPIVGAIDFQDLAPGQVAKAEEFMAAMQSMDNYRLGLYGLENGGVFEKKAHMLQSEQMMNASTTGLVMQDGLTNRQRACDIINSIWGLGVWVTPSESTQELDQNGDGQLMDITDEADKVEKTTETAPGMEAIDERME